MNQLDLIVCFMLGAAILGGWRLGFLARSGWVSDSGSYWPASPPVCAPRHLKQRHGVPRLVAVLILLGGAFAGQALGLMAGLRIHRVLPIGPIRLVDRSVGAALGALGVVLSFWLFMLPWLVDLPGWPAQQARSSVVAKLVDRYVIATAGQDAGAAPPHRRPHREYSTSWAQRPRPGHHRRRRGSNPASIGGSPPPR